MMSEEPFLRLLAAMAMGGLIGLERELRAKDAGLRTHFLVALGSALFTLVSQYGFGADLKDSSRVAAQVVSGIGFLGAGTIIFQKNVVHGLTTAAGLWVTAAIGLSCGTGMFAVAGATTVLVLLGLEVVNALHPHRSHTIISLSFSSTDKQMLPLMQKRLREAGFELKSYEMREKHSSHGCSYDVVMELQARRGGHISKLLACVSDVDDVSISNTD
ncbi:MAG: MgtC/SapB family protein [Prevotella sp.]|uniref:MgtC/SapB family protein n=1 Tax=Prevotella sp. P3-122 TaxID=2024223 RepID=UPI000B9706A3|nr:MgtC/SapB family protein [Prevotella sp. P3-122]MCI6462360.1 MgtC/SapB family protein [Prevotella sp.]MCI6501413.1 MgtC/SapB family protein [Prevotella sp.]MCI7341138.1 MgtC/SapB family protein [Prevotella sp.]MCI7361085.1 MgtC/SapB family protein [Prevotella sp.]MCI7687805.1 MgtC/SapB family protein [Prevotella sp.]